MIEREKEIMQKFLPRKINMKIKCKIYAAKKSGKTIIKIIIRYAYKHDNNTNN